MKAGGGGAGGRPRGPGSGARTPSLDARGEGLADTRSPGFQQETVPPLVALVLGGGGGGDIADDRRTEGLQQLHTRT